MSLITNGTISNTTLESSSQDRDKIEAGRFIENVLFKWKNPFNKKSKSQGKNIGKYKNNNEAKDISKILDIQKALFLLNSNNYEKTIDEFNQNFNNNGKIKRNGLDNKLIEFIERINFNLDDFIKNKNDYKNYIIDCSRKASTSYTIVYNSDNHNYMHERQLIKLNLPRKDNLELNEMEDNDI